MEQLSQHILDIARNSLEAGATSLEITAREDTEANLLELSIRDNGRGITPEEATRIQDPFYTTKPGKRVGLGIPLLMDAVERCGGDFKIEGTPAEGTIVTVVFPHKHPDRAPLGDIASTISVLVAGSKSPRIIYNHYFNEKKFCFDTRDIKEILGDVPLNTPEVLLWVNDYLSQKISELREVSKFEKFGRAG